MHRAAPDPDPDYPYEMGKIGPHGGWSFSGYHLVEEDRFLAIDYFDVMSYCGSRPFISDYHYRKTIDHWLGANPDGSTLLPANVTSRQLPGR